MPLVVLRPPKLIVRTKGRRATTRSIWGGKNHEDLVWIYRSPLPESQKIAGLVCFLTEKVDLYLDGELQDRPKTPFS